MALISKKTVRRWAYGLSKKGLVFDGGSHAELGNTVTYKVGLPTGVDYNLNEETGEFQFIVPGLWSDGTIRAVTGYTPGETATLSLSSALQASRVFMYVPFGVNLQITTINTYDPPPTETTYQYFATRIIVTGGELQIATQDEIDADPYWYNLQAEIDIEAGSAVAGWIRRELFHLSKTDYGDPDEPWDVSPVEYEKLLVFNSDNSLMPVTRNSIEAQGFRSLV